MTRCRCPWCDSVNVAVCDALDANDEVGAEMWGRCSFCRAEFRIERRLDLASPVGSVDGCRTPIVTPYVFHMWRPVH